MPTKQNRKLIRIGETSLGVILPKGWLRFHGLEHGDNVEIITNNFVHVKPMGGRQNEITE
jgi:hypothetical protein